MEKIYLDAPNLGPVEKEYLVKCLNSNYVSTVGPFVPDFEEEFARLLGAGAAVAVQSGTAALHMALHALGIGPGDEVIVPALTFIATVNPVLYVGARPVIVDVDPATWNIDPVGLEQAVTENTRAVIPVHLYGNPCQMDAIMEIARRYNLYVIEDATESLGALFNGHYTGTFGDFGCFSFNGNKLITTGGGGMLVTGDRERAQRVKFLVNQARDAARGYYHPEMGFNYRMTNIEAALGLAQLSRFRELLARKKRYAVIYREILGDIPGLQFQSECQGGESAHWLSCLRVSTVKAVKLAAALAEEGIPTRRVFMPVSDMPYLREYARPCPHARDIYEHGICLPSSTLNSDEVTKKAALTIRRVLLG
ncbi:LegC family aminotransferase [Thermincola ferriacetica]